MECQSVYILLVEFDAHPIGYVSTGVDLYYKQQEETGTALPAVSKVNDASFV